MNKGKGSVAAGCLAAGLVLLWSGVGTAEIANPSFETWFRTTPITRYLPGSWGRIHNLLGLDHPSFDSGCTSHWSTDGAYSLRIFSRNGKSFLAGDYQSFYQMNVDLTGMSAIAFDVRLTASPSGTFAHFEASLLVDGVLLWSEVVGGEYRDQQVDVSHLSGEHVIEMRITALDSGTFNGSSYWTQWDNFELIEGPAAVKAAIDLDPGTLNLHSNGQWVTCYIELEEGWDAMLIDGATVRLADIPACVGDQGWATREAGEQNITDLDGNGLCERMVKFDRAAVQAIVQPPETLVMVTGLLLDGVTPFEGTATIRVVDKAGKKAGNSGGK